MVSCSIGLTHHGCTTPRVANSARRSSRSSQDRSKCARRSQSSARGSRQCPGATSEARPFRPWTHIPPFPVKFSHALFRGLDQQQHMRLNALQFVAGHRPEMPGNLLIMLSLRHQRGSLDRPDLRIDDCLGRKRMLVVGLPPEEIATQVKRANLPTAISKHLVSAYRATRHHVKIFRGFAFAIDFNVSRIDCCCIRRFDQTGKQRLLLDRLFDGIAMRRQPAPNCPVYCINMSDP